MRLLGFILLSVLVFLHNKFILGSFSWSGFFGITAAMLIYAVVSWLILYLFYERVKIFNLGSLFLVLDVFLWVLAIYFTGGERSWLFFILLLRVADQGEKTFLRSFLFGHLSTFSYLLLVLYLAFVENRAISWAVELSKCAFICGAGIYLSLTARTAEQIRNLTAAAIRAAKNLIAQQEMDIRQLAAIVESSDDAIIGETLDGIILTWNPGAERLYGYSADEVRGKPSAILAPPGHSEKCSKVIEAVKGGEKFEHYEAVHVRKDGRQIDVSLTISPIKDKSGIVTGASIIARDITERKASERRRAARYAVAQILSEAEGLSDAAPQILAAIGESLKWEAGELWIVDRHEEVLRCVATWHAPFPDLAEFAAASYQLTFARGAGLPGRIWAGGEPLWIRDVARDGGFLCAQLAARSGLHAAFGFPIRHGSEILGAIEFFSREIREPDENLLEMATLIGSQIGLFLERKRAEDQIKASLKEKEVLLKEIHHRVKNNLQIISSLLNLQSRYIDDQRVFELFRESQERIRSIALIHERLYRSRDLAEIDFAEYLQSLSANLFRSYGVKSNAVKLKVEVDGMRLSVDTAIPIGLIVNELVSNSLKHAFPSGRKGEIRIRLAANGDNSSTLIVSDNGIGFPHDLDLRNARSLGLQLVNMLVQQLDGTIELDRTNGTTFKIVFASAKQRKTQI